MLERLNELVTDVSKYQVKIKPRELKAGGVRLNIIRSSGGITPDPLFSQHYEDCQKDEMDAAVYHWVDPIYSAQRQVDVLLKTIQNKKIAAIFLDLEQWWNNWGTWYQAVQKKIAWSIVPKIRPDLIALHARQTIDTLSWKTGLPIGIYTSYGFVTSYAPAIAEWLGVFQLWVANYVIKSAAKITCSWDELKNKFMPRSGTPILPPGAKAENVVGWQFTGDLISLPGMYTDASCKRLSPADVSLFDAGWLEKITGVKISPSPMPICSQPAYERYVVDNWVWRGLNFREQPGSLATVLCTLKAGTTLSFTEKRDGDWMRMDFNGLTGWVHSAYVKKL